LTPFVGKREESTQTLALEGASALAVDVDVGDVTVRSADREDVHVDIVKQSSAVGADLSKLEFRVSRPNERLVLRGVWTGDGRLSGTPSMNLDVTVPVSFGVREVQTAVGDVRVEDARGDLAADSETGDVTVQSVSGAVRAATQTGDVEVADVDVFAGARTQTGDVSVEVSAIDSDTVVETTTGDVTAAIGSGVNAEVRASTNTGDVSVRDLELDDATIGEEVAAGTLGDGGPTLSVEAQTGDVVLEALD
jgi:hypothetical protein